MFPFFVGPYSLYSLNRLCTPWIVIGKENSKFQDISIYQSDIGKLRILTESKFSALLH